MIDMKKENRRRCVKLFSVLLGNYHEYCAAYRTYRDRSGKFVPASQVDIDRFEANNLHKVEYLCGSFYVNGENPDMLPHPVRVALELKYGRNIRPTMAWLGKEDYIDRVRAKCAALGINI